VPSKAPQAVEVDKKHKGMFLGRAGFGRNKAQNRIDYKTFIYDVLDFESDAARIEFMYNSNDTDDHLPAFKNTVATIIKGVIKAVIDKTIPDTDAAILKYLKRIAKSKSTQKHDLILKKIRKEHMSVWPTMRAWNSTDANNYADDNFLPYKGDASTHSTSLGYCSKTSSFKTLFWDSMKKSIEFGGKDVFFTTWVQEPKPSLLQEQRENIIEKYEDMRNDMEKFVAQWLDMDIKEVKEKGKNRFPLKFNGFLPQNIGKNPNDKGNFFEKGIVDTKGKEWKRLDK